MDKQDKIIELFAKRVKKLREDNGYSQEEFAQEAEIDRSYYGRIERGEANPTLRNIAAIANVLRTSISELFSDPSRANRHKH